MKQAAFSFDKNKLAELSKKYGLRFVVLFGSFARREKTYEDIDIAVLTEKNPDSALFGDLFNEFSNLFPNEQIDLRFLNDSDLLFRFEVVKNGVLLYGDENAYTDYRLLTHRMYIDDGKKYFPFRDRLLENRQKALEAAL